MTTNQFADTQFIGILDEAFRSGDTRALEKEEEARHVRTLEELFVAIDKRDFDALQNILHEEVELEIVGPSHVAMTGRHRGRTQVIEAIRKNYTGIEDQRPTLYRLVAQGDTVVVDAHDTGRFRSSGQTYGIDVVFFYTFEGDKIRHIRELFDTASLMLAAEH